MKKLSASSYQLLARGEEGFSLIEVMLAMVILAFAMLGAMGLFQWADYGVRIGANGTRALALAESRLEAKRAGPWEALLNDDLDANGVPDIVMKDDGAPPDAEAADGVYTAGVEQDGIHLVWTVRFDRGQSPRTAGSAVIQAQASYQTGRTGTRTIRIGTVRANPFYVGTR
jgi:prepilin-type N-terminal cleavage/methylation domain-containing protein